MKIGLDFPLRYYPRSFLSLLLLAFALVAAPLVVAFYNAAVYVEQLAGQSQTDRKSTRLNSSHGYISYAVFCLKKKKMINYFEYHAYLINMLAYNCYRTAVP